MIDLTPERFDVWCGEWGLELGPASRTAARDVLAAVVPIEGEGRKSFLLRTVDDFVTDQHRDEEEGPCQDT